MQYFKELSNFPDEDSAKTPNLEERMDSDYINVLEQNSVSHI